MFDVVGNIKVSTSLLLNLISKAGSQQSACQGNLSPSSLLIPMGNRGKVNVEKLNCPNPLIAVAVACRVGVVQKWRIEIKFAGFVCFHEKRLNALVVNIF